LPTSIKKNMKKTLFVIIFSLLCLVSSFGQKEWSSESKLTTQNFKIKIVDKHNDLIYSQFTISHSVKGFDFLKKNLNQRVQNIFIETASWIDTTRIKNLDKQLDFQQLQFDMAEIHARKFRKRLLKNKKKIMNGFQIVTQISNEIMTEFSEMRLHFIKETENGRNEKKIENWRIKIG